MIEALSAAVHRASAAFWGPWTIALVFGTALFLTLRYRFIQVTRFGEAARTIVPRQQAGASGPLTPFQAFMTALAASIGTGNIAGVATAIVSGGPGAIFWIWCYGFFATTIKFSEAVLGISYRVTRGDSVSSGPMYYLRDGLRSPALAWLYALAAGIGALTTTPFTQPNSMAVVLESELAIAPWMSGVFIAVLTWLVIIGGVRSIGRVAERLAPAMVALYLIGGLLVILAHLDRLPAVIGTIFTEAFSFRAATGSTAGIAIMVSIRFGLARGIYANEAGYGTAAVAYGTARSRDPLQQGMNAIMEVFIISMVTSSISALTILLTGSWQSGATSTSAVAEAFNATMPQVGGWIVMISAFLFGYTTLIGWAYYGEQFLEYILGVRVAIPYRWVYCTLILLGAMIAPETVWAWGDLMNGLQIYPNLIGIIGLSGLVAKLARQRGGVLRTDPRSTP